MIDMAKNKIVRGGAVEDIVAWRVWFKTPFGYGETIEEALATIETAELNPHTSVKPVAVAIGETLSEVFD